MLRVRLFFEFFKIGLFAVGGGLASLPFLVELSEKTGWFTSYDLANLVAISESTPGPLGINMSTYVGFTTDGIVGSIIGPLGLVTPSIIVIIIVANVFNKFKDSKIVKNVFYGLRPASVALIAVACVSVLELAVYKTGYSFDFSKLNNLMNELNFKAIIYGIILIIFSKKVSKYPIAAIAGSAVIGILLQFSV